MRLALGLRDGWVGIVCGCLLAWGAAPACKKADFENAGADGGRTDGSPDRAPAADAPNDQTALGICPDDAPSRSKSKAESCACDRECQTGFCVDGICCASACGETCKACNLPSSLGDCAFVPAGGRPNDPSMCVAGTPSTCGLDGTCDGKGACRTYVRGTECQAGVCQGNTVEGIRTCDGNGQCSETESESCPPYACDPATHRCLSRCASDDQCSAGHQCVASSCGKSINGAACTSDGDCLSGFCVDEHCCNVACSGPCVSCKETGFEGHCSYLGAGLADADCGAEDRTTCGRTGLCDGAGRCTLYPENTVCGSSSCSGLLQNTARTCDGLGTCRESQLVDCAPFLCSNGACETSCDPNGTNVCEPGHACVLDTSAGVNRWICGQRKNGQPCERASDCESDQCVDGVCCENACTGACRSCNLPGSPGRCLNVAAGAPDPRKTCQDLGAAACATNGVCDGQGACQRYPAGTECGGESCVADTYFPPSTCNAAGQCVASRSRTCSPFRCNGKTCFGTCSDDSQCTEGNFCLDYSCGLKPNGTDCSEGSACQSGFCAQGVCCQSACTDACKACNLVATAGLCVAVADGAPDPQSTCAASPSFPCGMTGVCRGGTCAVQDKGIRCKPAVCATSSSVTPASTCDGAGTCVTPANQSCGAFACQNAACKSSCTAATEAQDCTPPNTCVNGSCGLKVNGAACTSAQQCQSGFCTEGVCCNTACSDAVLGGLCKTCKGVGIIPAGICANVAAGNADPKARCQASDAAAGNCSNSGTCDGAGHCQPWSSTTGCRKESCTGSMHTLPATCDGRGACPTANVVSCGSYVCSSTSPTCLDSCTSDNQCTGGLSCLQTTHTCGSKLRPGDPCAAGTDCDTGICSAEGVCCNDSCAAGCRTCTLPGSLLGVCSSKAKGSDPRSTTPVTCPAAGDGLCGNTGKCDGDGGCEARDTCDVNNNSCPADEHTQWSDVGLCSAEGTCEPQATPCAAGYLCTGGSCASTCTTADESTTCDTAAGYTCMSGICRKKHKGEACQPNQCETGTYCVDGFCCNEACDRVCWSCNLDGSEGTCSPVPAGTEDGTCVPQCTAGSNQVSGCNGSGDCLAEHDCPDGYMCGSDARCLAICAGEADCASGYSCAGTTCVPASPDGGAQQD